MNELVRSILETPFLQGCIGFFILNAGLFIVAAVQRRLVRLTAWVLTAMMVSSTSMMLIVGYINAARRAQETRWNAMEQEALAALYAGDASAAMQQIREAMLLEPGRPVGYLLGARAALLLGDVTAADHYYDQLLGLTDEQIAYWDMTEARDEIAAWAGYSSLGVAQQRSAAKPLAMQVEQLLSAERTLDPQWEQAAQNHAQLHALEIQLHAAKTDGEIVDAVLIDSQLQALMGQTGAGDARELRIDTLLWQEQYLELINWLYNDGVEGWLDLAELLLQE